MTDLPDGWKEKLSEICHCNIVVHIIAGIFPPEKIKDVLSYEWSSKTLILGYKQWGRAKGTQLPDMTKWRDEIKSLIYNSRYKQYTKSSVLSFDNLAIEQLGIRDCLLEKEWKNLYQGDEFTSSMYIDAVNEIYAPTFKVAWSEMGVLDFFRTYKNEDKE